MTFAISSDILLKLTTGAGYPPAGTFFQGEKQQMKKLSGAGIFRFITLLPVLTMLSFNAAAVTVAEVVFEQTSEPKLITDLFKHQVSVRAGQELDQKKINADLKNLFDTGVINPPDVRIEPVDGENVKVVYVISARPVVAFLTFEGNNKFDDQEIRKRLEVSQGQPLNNKALENSVAAIREFYHEKGYTDATVVPQIFTDDAGNMHVNIVIDEKLRQQIDEVIFSGTNGEFSDFTLKGTVANRWDFMGWLLPRGFIQRDEFENDKVRLRDLYWSKGYLDFEVEDIVVTTHADDAEKVDIEFKIHTGEPYTVGEVTFSGNSFLDTEILAGLSAFAPGDVYDIANENATVRAITTMYGRSGYADCMVNVERDADYSNHVVNMNISIMEGRPFTVAEVLLTGNESTKQKVILRELVIHDGDDLDAERIEISRQRLLNMGYFNRVDTFVTDSDDPAKRNVHFDVEERRAYDISVGAEFSDVNSLAGMASVSNNNFDLFNPWNGFVGGGQRLRLAGAAGFHGGGANLNFMEPWLFDLPLRFELNGYWDNNILPDWEEERLGVSTNLSHKIFDDFTSFTYGYKFESVKVHDMEIWSLMDEEDRDLVSEFSFIASRDTRDNPMNPTEGYSINFKGAVSPKFLGSSEDFYRLEASGSYYLNFFDKAIVWGTRAKVGVVSGFNRDEAVPLYERYFLGGGDSIRGFEWRTVSPVDRAGDPVGGQTMFIVSSEISHPIWQFIRGAAFVDIGSAYSGAYSFGPGGINIGAGYGLRIMIPQINLPLRLDLAYPVLSEQCSESDKLRFHFNLGYSYTW